MEECEFCGEISDRLRLTEQGEAICRHCLDQHEDDRGIDLTKLAEEIRSDLIGCRQSR